MGFTHYFETKKEIPQKKWNDEVIPGIKLILETAQTHPFEIPIVGPHGEPDTFPEFCNDHIYFNGLEDESHETMSIERVKKDFYFCKTARKPYDGSCVAMAIFMATCFPDHFSWSSDGEGEDDYQLEGVNLLKATFAVLELTRENILKAIKEKVAQV